MDNHLFGQQLKEFRINAKMGSRELSRLIGKTDTYVSQVERGQIKKPDFVTGYILLKCVGIDEDMILETLDNYGIRANTTLEYKKAKSFFIPSNQSLKIQMDWFSEESSELKEQVHSISEALNSFVEKDLTRSKTIINNLLNLITTDRNSFDFFCELFSCNITQINQSNKVLIISKIHEISALNEKTASSK